MKRTRKILKASLISIQKNGMRSLLTILGVIIGVSAVIVMVAIGEGSQQQIQQQINSLGTNLIVVFPGVSRTGSVRLGAGSYNRFTYADVEKLRSEATLISAVSAVVRTGGQVIGGGNNWSTSIYGVDATYFAIRNWEIKYGDFFTDADVKNKRKVALLGNTVATQLFPNEDPTGEKIRIRNIPFTVIGVLKPKGQSGMGQDQDDVILAPSTTVFYELKGGTYIDMINASAVSVAQIQAAQDQMRSILRESHKIPEGENDDFNIQNQADISEAVTQTSRIMTLLLGSIAGVSLLVGGIGIMNIMLVSVTERTREIGIRLSVGARDTDILVQFLSEAMVLSLAGGVIGIIISFIISYILNNFTQIFSVINPQVILISFVFSAMIGIFFGFYPARKASMMNPIDALHYE